MQSESNINNRPWRETAGLFKHLCMLRLFTALLLVTLSLSVPKVNASCPDCQHLSNLGAVGGVCARCLETSSNMSSQGLRGFCEVLVELLNDKTDDDSIMNANILSVANNCLTGQPVMLNERLSNEIQTFRERSEFMQRHIHRNLPGGDSEGYASLFSPEDLTVFFALMEAGEITDVDLDRLEKTFFIRIGWLSIEIKADLASYDWKQLRNERRFFAYLYYIMLRQQQARQEEDNSLVKRLHGYLLDYDRGDEKSIDNLFVPEHMTFGSYIESCVVPSSVLDMTGSWKWKWLTQYLNPQGWTMMYLQPQDWILRFLQEGRWNFLGRFYISDGTSTYQLPEPHSDIWILLALNDDQTVTLFTNYGMGMMIVNESDLGLLLEGMQSTLGHTDNLNSEPPVSDEQLQWLLPDDHFGIDSPEQFK